MPLLVEMVEGKIQTWHTSRREYGTLKGFAGSLDRLGGVGKFFHWEYPSNHQVFDDDAYWK